MAKPSFSTSLRKVWLLFYLVLLSWYLALCITQLSAVGGFLLSQRSHVPLVQQWVFVGCVWRKGVKTRWENTRGRAQSKPGPSSHPRLKGLSGEDSESNWGDGTGHLNFLMRLLRNPFYNILILSCNLPHESIFAGFPLQLHYLHFKG